MSDSKSPTSSWWVTDSTTPRDIATSTTSACWTTPARRRQAPIRASTIRDLRKNRLTGGSACPTNVGQTLSSVNTSSLQVNRLRECAIARRIPHGKPHPLLSGRVKRDTEFVAAEGPHSGQADDLAIHGLPVAPPQLGEFGRECPLRFRRLGPLRPGAFDAPVANQNFTAGHEEVPRA